MEKSPENAKTPSAAVPQETQKNEKSEQQSEKEEKMEKQLQKEEKSEQPSKGEMSKKDEQSGQEQQKDEKSGKEQQKDEKAEKSQKEEDSENEVTFEFQQPKPMAPVKKKSKLSPSMAAALTPVNAIGSEELGNPADGVSFPAPADVRAILKKRIPEIVAAYEKLDTLAPCQSPVSLESESPASEDRVKMEESAEEQNIASDYPASKTLRSIRKIRKS